MLAPSAEATEDREPLTLEMLLPTLPIADVNELFMLLTFVETLFILEDNELFTLETLLPIAPLTDMSELLTFVRFTPMAALMLW